MSFFPNSVSNFYNHPSVVQVPEMNEDNISGTGIFGCNFYTGTTYENLTPHVTDISSDDIIPMDICDDD